MATEHELHAKWISYKAAHGKEYVPHVDSACFRTFANNLRSIEKHNEKFSRGEVTYELGLNAHSDLTLEEFREGHFGVSLSSSVDRSAIPQHKTSSNASHIN